MASKYWIKLWIEILDDPKIGHMADRLCWRMVQLFLVAGEVNDNGALPPLRDLAWRLRGIGEEELESDLVELQKNGIVLQEDGVWYVKNFYKRQKAMTNAERQRRYRRSQASDEGKSKGYADIWGDEEDNTISGGELHDSNEYVTERNGESDKESDTDKESDAESAVSFIRAFLEFSGFSKPTIHKDQEKWERAAFEAVGAFGDKAVPLAKRAYSTLQNSNYTVAGPQSLLNTMRSLDAKKQADPYEVKQA